MPTEWSEKFETNITEVDTQHKRLFQLVNDLEAVYEKNKGNLVAKEQEIKKALSDLEQYTLSHFLIEERIMEDNDYPDLENHKLLHNKFCDKINEVKEDLLGKDLIHNEEKLDEYLGHLIKFLTTWLKNHIMVKDMDFKPYIRRVL